EPHAHAQVMVALGHAQVVGGGVISPLIVVKIRPVGRCDRSGRVRRGAPAKYDRAGIVPASATHQQQALWEGFVWLDLILSACVRKTEHRRIQNRWREDMRFLQPERV